MDVALQTAVRRSRLRSLPPVVLDELFAGAVRARVAAGAVTHSEGDRAPHVELVVTGLVRVFVRSPEGRTVTVRYCRPGALLGVMSLYSDHFTMPASTQALVDSSVLRMRPERAGALAARDGRMTQAWAEELSDRAAGFLREIAGYAFTTVRQRVARHVLDLAAANIGADRGQLVARVSQQALADAVGTAREVVVRSLRDLREAGVVSTERDRVIVLDPVRLAQEHDENPGQSGT
ncbi:Crp/Fnr family transcriptional regulator [Phytoactinopolyspora endophytica]|uniref:Crp/Fnr family transcriptional regulator n=1 Tax=Phytoactinopolyspora endophytica TaxID=1642495 RepID=UPI00101D721E|nr:Crp/Fnr family transcriptional regulator [Phytoactinopolyspora endophytica]